MTNPHQVVVIQKDGQQVVGRTVYLSLTREPPKHPSTPFTHRSLCSAPRLRLLSLSRTRLLRFAPQLHPRPIQFLLMKPGCTGPARGPLAVGPASTYLLARFVNAPSHRQ